ncbi:hypothetical protein R2O95_14450, partial [Faecalibacterium duncaniae]|nr:hypothetical protein [Faecalibacterium duncaniae]
PIDLTTLSSGWPAGAQLTPFRTRHRVPSRGYRLDLPRAGRFDLMAAGVRPGPGLRQVLNALLEAVITGQTPNEKDALLAAAAQ